MMSCWVFARAPLKLTLMSEHTGTRRAGHSDPKRLCYSNSTSTQKSESESVSWDTQTNSTKKNSRVGKERTTTAAKTRGKKHQVKQIKKQKQTINETNTGESAIRGEIHEDVVRFA